MANCANESHREPFPGQYTPSATLGGRILVGYPGSESDAKDGGCFREMRANAYVGAPSDVTTDDGVIRNRKVTRSSDGFTTISFTANIYAGQNGNALHWSQSYGQFGGTRIMLAWGKVQGAGMPSMCSAPLGYHEGDRAQFGMGFTGAARPC